MHPLSTFSLALLLGVGAATAAYATPVGGHVQDPGGKPLSHVFVRQDGGTVVAFTDEQGNFRLEFDPKAGRRLLFSAPNYQSAALEVGAAANPVVLTPISVVSAPVVEPAAPAAPPSLLGSRFELRYGQRTQGIGYGSNAVNGPIDGELGAGMRVRTGPWLWSGEAYRNRASVWLGGVTPAGATTFSPETLQIELGVGYPLCWGELEVAPMVDFLYRSVQSGTNGVAYSGTPLDYDQSRRALGVGFEAAQRVYGPLTGTLGLMAYPYASLNLIGQPAAVQLSGLWGATIKVGVGYPLLPGVRAEAGYRFDSWRAGGGYLEDAGIWTVGLASYPAEVTP